MGPVNPLSIPQWLLDEWAATDQPVQERGNVLPLGTYEDGSVHMAWPEVLGVPAFKRMYERGAQWDASSPDGQQHALDALGVGGSLALGGVGASAASPKPTNALMSNGVRGSADLPMDQASRLARAREMGFDTDRVLYHGGNGPWLGDEFVPSNGGNLGGGVYATENPRVASGYAERVGSGDLMDGGHVTPFYARGPLASSANYDEALTKARGAGFSAQARYDEALNSLKDDGYAGIRGDDLGRVVNIFDPRNIRSINAAFDPAMKDSANLLAANPKEAAAVQAGVSLANDGPKGITAYHGSPHDFDRFDISKILTGEGANAYGSGLYFAENEGVARSYRDTLGDYSDAVKWKGDQPPTPLQQSFLNRLSGPDVSSSRAMDVPRLKREIAMMIRDAEDGMFPNAERAAKYRAELDELRRIEPLIETKPPGRMYQVRINAEPDQFLDWDKPLSGQSEAVREAFAGALPDNDVTRAWRTNGVLDNAKAASLLSAFSDGTNGAIARGETTRASNALREAGIPGIKYLDQGSRGAGEGSSNYVVFDDALIEILKKYSNPPTASLPSLATGQGEEDQFLDALLARYGMN